MWGTYIKAPSAGPVTTGAREIAWSRGLTIHRTLCFVAKLDMHHGFQPRT
jgi:hypothetical protein